MKEHEVSSAADAAFYLANEVINEYHGFPVVQCADIGGSNMLHIMLNGRWFVFESKVVRKADVLARLEELAE